MNSRIDYQPGNGYRYIVFVADLPCDDFQGGNRDTHRVVTIWMPGDRFGRTYVFEATSPLSDYYVLDKLSIEGADDLRHASNAIRAALGRQPVNGERASTGGPYNYLGEEGPDQRRDREERATDTYRDDMGL